MLPRASIDTGRPLVISREYHLKLMLTLAFLGTAAVAYYITEDAIKAVLTPIGLAAAAAYLAA